MGLKKAKSITHNGKKLTEILEAHERFFRGQDGGERANLAGADLSGADLSGVNLSGAILTGANLAGTDLRKAKLPGADLSGAKMHGVDLRNSDLTEAILPGADLSEAQASGIEFFRCDLSDVNFERALLRKIGEYQRREVRGRGYGRGDFAGDGFDGCGPFGCRFGDYPDAERVCGGGQEERVVVSATRNVAREWAQRLVGRLRIATSGG
jgi:uncharacterized protein YjbI with pentapeptide repeats